MYSVVGNQTETGETVPVFVLQGGLKAVVWTDAFQMVVMVVGFLTVLIQGAIKAGGIESVWSTAYTGGRMHIFEYVFVQTFTQCTHVILNK